jgi:Ca2+-binding RTX toxin-like protein
MYRFFGLLTLCLTSLICQSLAAQQVTFDATNGVKIVLPANQTNKLELYVYDYYTDVFINGKQHFLPQGVQQSSAKKLHVTGGDQKDEISVYGFSTVDLSCEYELNGGNDLFSNYLNRGPTVYGGDGHDTINCGNFGSEVYPGFGNDTVNGGAGGDYVSDQFLDIYAPSGDDTYILKGEDDVVDARGGNDYIHLGAGDDQCNVHNGVFTIHGAAGNDRILTDRSEVTAYLGDGDDLIDLFYATSFAKIVGGNGDDEINLDTAAFPSSPPSYGYRFYDVTGGPGEDHLRNSFFSNSIYDVVFANVDGGADDDYLRASTNGMVYLNMLGKGGKDRMFKWGGSMLAGSEVVDGGADDDILSSKEVETIDLGVEHSNTAWLGWRKPTPPKWPAQFIGGHGADKFEGQRFYAWSNFWVYKKHKYQDKYFFKIIPYDGAVSYDLGNTGCLQDYDPSEGDQEIFDAIALPSSKIVQATGTSDDDFFGRNGPLIIRR